MRVAVGLISPERYIPVRCRFLTSKRNQEILSGWSRYWTTQPHDIQKQRHCHLQAVSIVAEVSPVFLQLNRPMWTIGWIVSPARCGRKQKLATLGQNQAGENDGRWLPLQRNTMRREPYVFKTSRRQKFKRLKTPALSDYFALPPLDLPPRVVTANQDERTQHKHSLNENFWQLHHQQLIIVCNDLEVLCLLCSGLHFWPNGAFCVCVCNRHIHCAKPEVKCGATKC